VVNKGGGSTFLKIKLNITAFPWFCIQPTAKYLFYIGLYVVSKCNKIHQIW